jgi:hypothetical protein
MKSSNPKNWTILESKISKDSLFQKRSLDMHKNCYTLIFHQSWVRQTIKVFKVAFTNKAKKDFQTTHIGLGHNNLIRIWNLENRFHLLFIFFIPLYPKGFWQYCMIKNLGVTDGGLFKPFLNSSLIKNV